MSRAADELEGRANAFTRRVLAYLRTLDRGPVSDTLARQLARCSGSISASYRATRRSRSRAEFIARLAVVLEEADETVHWLEQLQALSLGANAEIGNLLDEAQQLRAIFGRSVGTARQNYAMAARDGKLPQATRRRSRNH